MTTKNTHGGSRVNCGRKRLNQNTGVFGIRYPKSILDRLKEKHGKKQLQQKAKEFLNTLANDLDAE